MRKQSWVGGGRAEIAGNLSGKIFKDVLASAYYKYIKIQWFWKMAILTTRTNSLAKDFNFKSINRLERRRPSRVCQ